MLDIKKLQKIKINLQTEFFKNTNFLSSKKTFYSRTSSVRDGFLHADFCSEAGELPMPTFGHPEVYICVPLCLVFR